ncbi:hypothetical protein GCK32_008504 [Trichostrongylus colubriformis]|uniref:Uncharacterized protein n=1 Tax=Trichostrongylus colubriformis TaxID=6319 RepID=A0AAN8FTD1_TRICO
MLTSKIGRIVPPEMYPYHQYYAQLLQPYVPYSEAQLEYIMQGNQLMPATPPQYSWLQTAYNNNINGNSNNIYG